MHLRKTLLLIFFIANSLYLLAQQNPGFKHEIGISPFAVEWNSEPLNKPIAAKWFYRAFYNHHFDKWTWVNSLSYGKNNIKDKDEDCRDCFEGIGRMKELTAATGLRFRFFRKGPSHFKPFIEAGGYFTKNRYSGVFEGGFTGQGLSFDKTGQIFGIYGQYGVTYTPAPRVAFFAATGYWGGCDFIGDQKGKSNGYHLVQLGVGFFPFK